jgi:hypothetical protein
MAALHQAERDDGARTVHAVELDRKAKRSAAGFLETGAKVVRQMLDQAGHALRARQWLDERLAHREHWPGAERGDRRFGAPQGMVERHQKRARDTLSEAPGQARPRQRVELADALQPQPPQGAASLAIEPQRLDRQESKRACLGPWRDDGEGGGRSKGRFGKTRCLSTVSVTPAQAGVQGRWNCRSVPIGCQPSLA